MPFKRRLFLSLLFVSLLIVLLQFNKGRTPTGHPSSPFLDRTWVTLYSPLQRGWYSLKKGVTGIWSHYVAVIHAKKENEELKREGALKNMVLLSLKDQLHRQRESERVAARLDLLGLKGVSAHVIAYDPYAQVQSVWISAGTDQGVKVDLPVITVEGLVGRVIRSYGATSQVLLLIDPHFAVDVVNEKTGVRALVVGSGREGELKRYPFLSHLEFLRLGDAMHPGDLLLTSGMGGLYPPRIPVGTLVGDKKGVLPVFDISKLDELYVVTGKI